ncbi:MAG: T9SS type A sorting domain-containing protein [Cryomorphaceae bacterium]|nr:T9SS type A sorting domain-containing protein [Flavobacteriales bacterium]
MKAHVLAILAGIFCQNISNAQTISNISPQVGDEAIVAIDFPVEEPGPAGMDVTWDFSGLEFGQIYPYSVIDAADAPENETFPGATMAFEVELFQDFVLYSFFDFSDGDWTNMGSISVDGGEVFGTIFSDPQVWLTTPVDMESTGSDTYEGITQTGASDNTISGSMEWSVDGSGTLILPNATYTDVLRVRSEGTETITITVSGFEFEFESNVVNHYWIKDGVRFPLMQTNESEDMLTSEVDFSASALVSYTSGTVGVEDEFSAAFIRLFPNPATDRVFVKLESDAPAAERIEVYDSLGRLVASEQRVLRAGEQTELYTGNLTAGLYIAKLIGKSGAVATKLVIE